MSKTLSILQFDDHRTYLKAVLDEKIQNNPLFSLRAFAKFLTISHVALSNVLAGKRNLSSDTALKIAKRLGMNEQERRRFSLMVQLSVTKNAEACREIQRQIDVTKPNLLKPLDETQKVVLNQWYHFPVSCLLGLPDFSPAHAAKRLGITAEQVQQAVSDLIDAGVVAQDDKGNYRQLGRYLRTPAGRDPSAVIEEFHQYQKLAITALKEQSSKERFASAETFTFSKENVEKARALTEEYLAQMLSIAGPDPVTPPTDVYYLSVFFFNLTPQRK